MDRFEQQLESELARLIDPIVETPAPPRSRGWRDGRRGRLRIFQGSLPISGLAPLEVPEVLPLVAPATVAVTTYVP